MAVLVRAIAYSTLFIGVALVFLPAQALSIAGVARPARLGALQLAGMVAGAAGTAIAIGCVLTFAVLGRGTPAPFDPPRRLVVRGPYRYVRNPMYLGAGIALAGAALFYETAALWAYAAGFLVLMHLAVVLYEEPTLRRTFGDDYEAYSRQVHRWWPKMTLFQIKLVHTVIFWVLSVCTVYALYSGMTGRITTWTWVAIVLLLVESAVLAASGWTCPLTILAERQGALQGSVADIFLPKWLADRIFPVCGTMYAVALVLIAWRVLR